MIVTGYMATGVKYIIPKNICAGDCFAELWCHVYGSGAWDDNFGSWVWVYGFEIVERRIP